MILILFLVCADGPETLPRQICPGAKSRKIRRAASTTPGRFHIKRNQNVLVKRPENRRIQTEDEAGRDQEKGFEPASQFHRRSDGNVFEIFGQGDESEESCTTFK